MVIKKSAEQLYDEILRRLRAGSPSPDAEAPLNTAAPSPDTNSLSLSPDPASSDADPPSSPGAPSSDADPPSKLIAESTDRYACSREKGRPVKVQAQVVPDLVFREIQGALNATPIWFRKPGETKANPASTYWFNNRERWWGELWDALKPWFEDLMTPEDPVTPKASSAPDWRKQVQMLIQQVLESALNEPHRGPTVLQVPPGLGKTTGTIQALCRPAPSLRALAKRRHLRILWFVRESRVTEKESGSARVSMGSEVLAEFERRGASAQVIESQVDVAASKAQRKRARWQKNVSQPEVRVLSHAHLPLMFRDAGAAGPSTSWLNGLKRLADLVVVDEDPLQSLIFTEADLPDLPLWPELVALMESAGVLHPADSVLKCPRRPEKECGQKEAYWDPPRESPDQLFYGTYQQMTLEDHDAWMRLWAETLTAVATEQTPDSEAVWNKLKSKLLKICFARKCAGLPKTLSRAQIISERQVLKAKVADFVEALRLDLLGCLNGESSTLRFGLLWVPDADEPTRVQLQLRFSVLKPLSFIGTGLSAAPLPVVILDAYADEYQYRKVFGPETVLAQLEHNEAFHLQVEVLDLAKELQKFTVVNGFAQRHLLRMMTESTLCLLNEHQHLPRNVLFLGPQAVTSHQPIQRQIIPVINAQKSYQFAHRWLHYLTPVQHSTDTSQRFQSAYWFAGRGRNHFSGSDVVALSPPRYPRRHRNQLAAIAPQTISDNEVRERLFVHAETAELLQMLHRGRQVFLRLQEPNKVAPRVLVLFSIGQYALDGKAEQRVLEPRPMVLPAALNQVLSYDQLVGLPLKVNPKGKFAEERGKLELTKLVGVGVLMELLGRVNTTKSERRVQRLKEPALPEGWFPERLLVRFGLLGQTRPDTVPEGLLIRAYLDQLELPTATPHSAPSFRFTAAAIQRAGLWETMPIGKKLVSQAWAPPGEEKYLKHQLRAFFKMRFDRSILVEHHPLKELGVIWRLEDLKEGVVGDIQTWSHLQIRRLQRQDQGGQAKTQSRLKRTALPEEEGDHAP